MWHPAVGMCQKEPLRNNPAISKQIATPWCYKNSDLHMDLEMDTHN